MAKQDLNRKSTAPASIELQSKIEELARSNDDVVNLLNSSGIAILFLDRALHIKLYSPPMAELMNLRRIDIDHPIADITGKVQFDEFIVDAQLVLEEATTVERVVQSHSDIKRSYLRRMVPYRARNNRIDGVVVTFVDISERYHYEKLLEQRVEARTEELSKSRKQLILVLQSVGAAGWEMDREQRVELISPDIHQAMFGDLPAVKGKVWEWWLERIHPEERSNVERSLQKALESNDDRWEHEYRFRVAGGSYHWISDIAHISRDEAGAWQSISGAMIDINENREMALKVRDISTREQEAIGRELHDGLGQRLTALRITAIQLQANLTRGEPPKAQMLADMVGQLKEASAEVSRLSRGLAPITISPDGLADALAALIEQVDGQGLCRCRFDGEIGVAVNDPTVAQQVYRIAQEALNNALKYANAKAITVRLRRTGSQLNLTVEDDGEGFDTAGARKSDGLGHRIMRYRANTIGAVLSIDSVPGKGTRINCALRHQDLPDGQAHPAAV